MSQMFFFRPIFVIELIIAEILFAKDFERRKLFWLRAALSVIGCIALSFLAPPKAENFFVHFFTFTFLFALTLAAGVICFDAPFKSILLCAVAGYTVQHIASEAYEMFNVTMETTVNVSLDFYDSNEITAISAENYYFLIVYIFLYTLVYSLNGVFFAPTVRKAGANEMGDAVTMALSALILLIDLVVSSVVTFVVPTRVLASVFPKDKTIVFVVEMLLHFYNFLCCILVIVLLVEVPRRSGAESELKVVKKMRMREKDQYALMKENIEVINVKCHDLKHKMYAVFNEKGFADEEKEEIKKAIDIYDSAYRTPSEALNVVLTEKSLVCKSKGIDLSCILDATRLDFMPDYEVYSLFGNLLDNAIEATANLKASERSIGLKITANGKLVIIKIFNNFAGETDFKDGLPVTTKNDKAFHGYGLKSVKHTVEKYGGSMDIKTDKQVFTLTILFPSAK